MRQKAHQELLQRIKELENENNLLRQERKEHGCGDKYMREILNNIPAPIYLKDDQENYLMINKKYEELAHVSFSIKSSFTSSALLRSVMSVQNPPTAEMVPFSP